VFARSSVEEIFWPMGILPLWRVIGDEGLRFDGWDEMSDMLQIRLAHRRKTVSSNGGFAATSRILQTALVTAETQKKGGAD
jgi:hypothetical protein